MLNVFVIVLFVHSTQTGIYSCFGGGLRLSAADGPVIAVDKSFAVLQKEARLDEGISSKYLCELLIEDN